MRAWIIASKPWQKNTFWELLLICICSWREYGKNISGPSFYSLFDFWGGLHDKVGFGRLEQSNIYIYKASTNSIMNSSNIQPKLLQREMEKGVNRSCSSLFIYIYAVFMSTQLIKNMHDDIKTIIQLRLFIRKIRKLSISNTNISFFFFGQIILISVEQCCIHQMLYFIMCCIWIYHPLHHDFIVLLLLLFLSFLFTILVNEGFHPTK